MEEIFFDLSDVANQIEPIEPGMEIEHFFSDLPIADIADLDSELVFGATKIAEIVSDFNMQNTSESLWLLSESGVVFDVSANDDLIITTVGDHISLREFDSLLETQEIDFEKIKHASLEELIEALAQEDKVFCYLSKSCLCYPNIPLLTQSADCIVQIFGIDLRPETTPSILIFLHGDGSKQYDLSTFLTAWHKSDNLCYLIH